MAVRDGQHTQSGKSIVDNLHPKLRTDDNR